MSYYEPDMVGWQKGKFLFSGGNGIIYAVDQVGRLLDPLWQQEIYCRVCEEGSAEAGAEAAASG